MKMMRIVLEATAEDLIKEVDRVVEGDDRMLLFDFLSSIEMSFMLKRVHYIKLFLYFTDFHLAQIGFSPQFSY